MDGDAVGVTGPRHVEHLAMCGHTATPSKCELTICELQAKASGTSRKPTGLETAVEGHATQLLFLQDRLQTPYPQVEEQMGVSKQGHQFQGSAKSNSQAAERAPSGFWHPKGSMR
jgi:hypothetical protein